MLFDLTSPRRKRVIRVVYAVLALLFFVGFVGFGVGGNLNGGGILDALGITDSGGGGGSAGDAAQDSIDKAQKRLDADPKNEKALAALVLAEIQFGNAVADTDETTGSVVPTDDSLVAWGKAADDWQSYVELNPKKADAGAAGQVLRVYPLVFDDDYKTAAGGSSTLDAGDLQARLDGAKAAAQAAVDANRAQGPLVQLALFSFAAGDPKGAEKAVNGALAIKNGDIPKAQITKTIKAYRKQGKRVQKAVKALAKVSAAGGKAAGEQSLQDPFGGLSGGGSGGSSGAVSQLPGG